jgi:hypothetical protein
VFTERDLKQIRKRGMTPELVQAQLNAFERGFPHANLERPCTLGDGIVSLQGIDHERLIEAHNRAASKGRLMKFVPASGAATRMFKSLLSGLECMEKTREGLHDKSQLKNPDEEAFLHFLNNLNRFPFINSLQDCLRKDGLDVEDLLLRKDYQTLLNYLLTPKGLNLASLPKGLMPFHTYPDHVRTPLEEHLVEGAAYSKDKYGQVPIHFTISPEHDQPIKSHIRDVIPRYEGHNVKYRMTVSFQDPATDTIAVDMENRPLRDGSGELVFRPGGHGALLSNLHHVKGDIVFIKNIDNVVMDRLKDTTYHYKMLLAGYLLDLQEALFQQLSKLSNKNPSASVLDEALLFAQDRLSLEPPENSVKKTKMGIRRFLLDCLNRPLRVCGMVRNVKEPGGGPFWVRDGEGNVSLQIIESSQVNHSSETQRNIWGASTHFNPVDLVCAVRDRRGVPYKLLSFTDPETGFITEKSKDGKILKALELPGLWNGAMANWNTVFLEVPLVTFNPVKTVLDLLRPEHQKEEIVSGGK